MSERSLNKFFSSIDALAKSITMCVRYSLWANNFVIVDLLTAKSRKMFEIHILTIIFRNFYFDNNTTQRRFVLDIMLTDRIFLETIPCQSACSAKLKRGLPTARDGSLVLENRTPPASVFFARPCLSLPSVHFPSITGSPSREWATNA